MKTKRIYRRGFAALALIFSLAACTVPAGSRTGETIPQGMGLARIRLGAGEDAQSVVRTVLPGIEGYYFTLEFTAPGKTMVNKTLDGVMNITVALEPAAWNLEVKGYTDSGMTTLKVKGSISVSITAGTESSFDVYLTPDFSSGGTGTLNYDISFPASVSRAILGLYPIDDTPGTSHEIDISLPANRTGTLSALPEGSYQAIIELYGGSQAAAQTEAAHIYGGLTTTLTRSFATADFAACPPVIAGTTLADKLDAALASPSGSYTIVLNGTETDLAAFEPKTLNVTDGKNITITIRGGGNEVQVDRTETPLFTLGASSDSSLNLAVQDLTLRGRNANSVPVVRIEDRGTLLMKTGSLITGNVSSSSGGGVYINGGTFSMTGGAVSGNTSSPSSSYGGGGGVSVSSGTFSMTGGAVSGNISSPSSYGGGGGGVYVNGGTFSMTGGAVSGNTSSSSSYGNDGGGVSVSSGTFSMTGGAVSGNICFSQYSYGGGVSVSSGTFSMTGGVVSGNTSSSSTYSYGGGVSVSSGTFSMTGGAVSGNTSSSYYSSFGGGVYVINSGTFSMTGGAVSGNTSSSSYERSSGGGVCVTLNGTFSMTGGAVSGNTSSSYESSSGGGVYVTLNGTFTMTGGVVSGNNILSGTHGNGMEVMVSTNATFKISGDAQPERVFLSNNTRSITISGSLSGGLTAIDLGITNIALLSDWENAPVLKLDMSYGSGNLANLKTYFTLGNSTLTESPYTETAITGYEISDGGLFVVESGN
jgi:hypothetical protein